MFSCYEQLDDTRKIRYQKHNTLSSLKGAFYIFQSFGTIGRILGCFEYTVLLKDLLEGVSNVEFIIAAHYLTQ